MGQVEPKTFVGAAANEESAQTWETFVSPSVQFKTYPDTRKLIESIMPCFPKPCRVIAGYLNDDDQYWRVSYHWELLYFMLKKASVLPISQSSKDAILKVLKALDSNSPDPASGYMVSKKVGEPHDNSTVERINERWSLLKHAKVDFRRILDKEEIPRKYPPSKRWDLAVAPVSKPGTSKHGSGYALDIEAQGNNGLVRKICESLGATLIFDEKSHVHVEFKQDMLVDNRPFVDNIHDGRWSGWMHYRKVDANEWYVHAGNRTYGPYVLSQMEQFLRQGRISPVTLVIRTGTKNWLKFSDEPTLRTLRK